MAGWLAGKVALVTGGASGIGRAVVEGFIAEGARVCVLERSAERLERLSGQLGECVAPVQGDVTLWDDNRRAVERCVAAFGQLDIFVGNAGIFDGFARLQDLPPAIIGRAFDEVFQVNVKGYLLGARAALPALLESRGNMVFTVSGAGFYPAGGGPIYTASKHAVVGLIRQLAFELAPDVRVNGVAPGGTITELSAAPSLEDLLPPHADVAARAERIKRRNPLRVAQQPEDHVGAYLLLASDRARAITGAIIQSDGGLGVRGVELPAMSGAPTGPENAKGGLQ